MKTLEQLYPLTQFGITILVVSITKFSSEIGFGGFQNSGVCLQAFPSFLPLPFPPIYPLHLSPCNSLLLASHADVLRLVTRSSPRSWGGTRDKPKNVCMGG